MEDGDIGPLTSKVIEAATPSDALAPESYPQTPTDTAEKLTGHPGSRGLMLPIGIPEGGFMSEPFTWARAGERLHVPHVLHGPFQAFHQLHDYLRSGGDPEDQDAQKLGAEVALGMLGIGGTTATNGIYLGSRMRDSAISIIKGLGPEDKDVVGISRNIPDKMPNRMGWSEEGRAVKERLPGEIRRPNPDSNMFEVSKYDLESEAQARFGKPYDELTPDMQRWVKSQSPASMKAANDPEAVKPPLEVVPKGTENFPDLMKRQGLHFEEHTNGVGQTNIHIYDKPNPGKDDYYIGRIYVRDVRGRDALQIGNISLDNSIQRKGIATSIQNYLEQKFKKPMIPDSFLSNAEYMRWQKIDPEAVAHYRPVGGESWEGQPRADTPRMMKRRRELRGEDNNG
jgi:hypothetical protein